MNFIEWGMSRNAFACNFPYDERPEFPPRICQDDPLKPTRISRWMKKKEPLTQKPLRNKKHRPSEVKLINMREFSRINI